MNGHAVSSWTGAGTTATTYTTAKNLVAATLLVALAGAAARRAPRLHRGDALGLLAIGLIGGAVPFVLFFEGLARATSGQAAAIHKSLLIWVVLLAVPILGERVTRWHVAAVALLVVGQVAVIGVEGLGAGAGEAMILGATLLWSIEVVLARRVMTRVPAPTAAAARMGIGSVALVIWSVARGGLGEIGGVGAPEIAWVLTTGAILATFVALWYGALSRAPAVDVSAMLVPAVLVTAALRAGFDGVPVPAAPALVAIAVGTALVLVGSRRSRPDHVGAATGH